MINKDKPVEIIINPSLDVGAGFRLRTKAQGSKEERFMIREHLDLCRLLIDLTTGEWTSERLMSIPKHLFDRLLELGVLIDSRETPPEIYFRCDLESLPLDLVPDRWRARLAARSEPQSLRVNRSVYSQIITELPGEIGHRIKTGDSFIPHKKILWVDDPATHVLAPYWCSSDLIETVRDLIGNRRSPLDLAPQIVELLRWIDILAPEEYLESRGSAWDQIYAPARDQFRKKEYAVLRNLIHPLQIAALRRHFRALQENKQIYIDTTQVVGGRYVMHNEGAAAFIHDQLTDLVCHVTQQQVQPSFSNLAVYLSNALLDKHVDRPQCLYNISLLIDTNPEVEISDSWPLYLEIDGQAEAIRLEMGDAVLYSGTRIPHWRDALPEGNTVTVISCHFVSTDFKGSLN
jgi:hypothetical protein